jgi:hypothetical protein
MLQLLLRLQVSNATLLLLLHDVLHLDKHVLQASSKAALTSTLLGTSAVKLLCTAALHCQHAVATATKSACCNLFSTSPAIATGSHSHRLLPCRPYCDSISGTRMRRHQPVRQNRRDPTKKPYSRVCNVASFLACLSLSFKSKAA